LCQPQASQVSSRRRQQLGQIDSICRRIRSAEPGHPGHTSIADLRGWFDVSGRRRPLPSDISKRRGNEEALAEGPQLVSSRKRRSSEPDREVRDTRAHQQGLQEYPLPAVVSPGPGVAVF
jgi:hypothetical protein